MADAVEKVLPAAIGVSRAWHDTSSKRSIIKVARRPTSLTKATILDKLKAPKEVCPNIRVLVFSNKPTPKWGNAGNSNQDLPRVTMGYAMIDTGATVSLVTKKWYETHKVDYTPVKKHPVVQAANGQPLNVDCSGSSV